ncbi:Uncharacterised protein [uncultured Clostridium sp.]|uniref:hypothetical protein n=1 Tax=uncultured Clostridium sp. TaxID=59620 RepID=UPI000822CA5A|nr:hypothetical protein [uncultured Clostridium sp.]SCJ61383.1 Uncharacterised protein [uncultured Clostridium sp.]
MKLAYNYPSIKYSIDSILEFQGEEQSSFWSEPLFYFYPQIDRVYFKSANLEERKNYLKEFFYKFDKDNKIVIEEKVNKYNEKWNIYEPQIIEALEEAFEINLEDKFNDMLGNISFNPISPRYLDSNSFDVFYLNSENGALGLSLHEIIHFVWFYVWNNHFHDSYEEYETPSLKWILSEMVVEPIMRDERLASINPYFQHRECVYPYFYTFKIEKKPILDILYEMYKSMSINEFMEKSYELCLNHEEEIRKHIKESEQ